jgi:hypothetical protein
MDPTVQLGTRCLEPHGTARVPVAATGGTKITTGVSSLGAMWMQVAQMEFQRVYMQAPRLHSSVTSLAAALRIVTATLLGMQAGTTCGLLVAPMIPLVDTHIRFTNLAIVHANSKVRS